MKPYEQKARAIYDRYRRPDMPWEELSDKGRAIWIAEARRRAKAARVPEPWPEALSETDNTPGLRFPSCQRVAFPASRQ